VWYPRWRRVARLLSAPAVTAQHFSPV
jgi:hypothetical protein